MFSFEMAECNNPRDSVDEFIDFNCILLKRMIYLDEKKKKTYARSKRRGNFFKIFQDQEEIIQKKSLSKKIETLINQMNLK